MAGQKRRSGRFKRTIYTRVIRIQLTEARRGLLPFFQKLDDLPRGQRDDYLLDAIEHGAAQAQADLGQGETELGAQMIENFLNGF